MPLAAKDVQKKLDKEIHTRLKKAPGTVGICAKNLKTGAGYALRADEKVQTASTIKLPILVGLHRAVADGRLRWSDTIPLPKDERSSGSGILVEFADGTPIQLRDYSNLMIVISDNTATNVVLEKVGADAVNAEMDRLGLKETRSLRKVNGDTLARPGWSEAGRREENRKFGLGVTTPREMVRLLELLHRGEVVSTAASKDILATMSRQQYKDSIGRRLGGLKVASKSGGLDRLRSDVGIVETPDGPIALAITVSDLPNPDWTADNPGQILIADLSRILVAGLRN